MQIKRFPEDCRVEELFDLPGEHGPHAYYRVEARDLSTSAVRDILAAQLKVTSSNVVFSASKDAGTVTVQYASVRKRGPEVLEGEGVIARRVGWGPRALRSTNLLGNHFTFVVRDLDMAQVEAVGQHLRRLAETGLPNYWDEQQFSSFSAQGFIGKAILMREAEQAIRFYLAIPMASDSPEVCEFKQLVESHWGQWGYLLHKAPRPSNFRSVITFLKDHPKQFRKALNLVHDDLLSVYLVAYQAWVWNCILGHYLTERVAALAWVEIAGRRLPLPEAPPASRADFELSMPNLTVDYPSDFMPSVEAVLAEAGLTLEDFKARILRRVYLPKGLRKIWFAPTAVQIGEPVADEFSPSRYAVPVDFELDVANYATLVLKTIAARLGIAIQVQ